MTKTWRWCWCWLAAFALGCGGAVPASGPDDASVAADASDAGVYRGLPLGSTLGCGSEPHPDSFCSAWAASCVVCGLSATTCEREHFDEMCVADEALRSDAWRAAVVECARVCSEQGGCIDEKLGGSITPTESDIASRFCARCPLGPNSGASPGQTCVEAITAGVALAGFSDAVWAQIAPRCLPAADAGVSCEADFWACAKDTFQAAHANVICNSERRNWW